MMIGIGAIAIEPRDQPISDLKDPRDPINVDAIPGRVTRERASGHTTRGAAPIESAAAESPEIPTDAIKTVEVGGC